MVEHPRQLARRRCSEVRAPDSSWPGGQPIGHALKVDEVGRDADDELCGFERRDGTLKLPLDEQRALLHDYPNLVDLPAGWSKHGRTTIQLSALDYDQVTELLALSIETVTRRRTE